MMAILARLPWSWRIALAALGVLAVGGAYGVGHVSGYGAGHAAAKAKGDAAYASLERDYARQYAQALERNAAKLREEAEKAIQAASVLARAKEEHAKTEQSLRTRIAAVTRGSVHHFSPDFVRLFNESVNAVPVHRVGGNPVDTGRTAPVSGAGPAADAGVRGIGAAPERSLPLPTTRGNATMDAGGGAGPALPDSAPPGAAVTERDVLAYIIYYGKRSRDMEAQLRALIGLSGNGYAAHR